MMSLVWKPLKKEDGPGRKLCCFFKIFRYKCPKYLFNIIPTSVSTYKARNTNNISLFKVKYNFFRNSFFPSAVIEWNKLDLNIRISESLNLFKKTLLNFIRPSESTVFNCHNPKRVKLLTRLRLGLSHLCEHKFKHSFQDSLNLSVAVVMILKRQLITFSTVLIFQMKDQLS